MQIGVNILNFGPGANPDDLTRWAQISEALGYHSLMLADHVAITPDVAARYPEPWYDPLTTIAWLAGQTTRIKLGTTVIVLPYRHPVLMARMVANIDQLSRGRFIFGIGVGNFTAEFAALGADHPHRGSVSDEYLRIMFALWHGSESAITYNGRFADIADVSPITPYQTPHPPVWVGGNSEIAHRRAARYGDAWHPIIWRNLTIDWAAGSMAAIRKQAHDLGRDEPAFCPRIPLDVQDKPIDGQRVPGTGSLEQIHEDLSRLQALGAEHVTLDWFTGDLEASKDHARGWQQFALLAAKVLDLEHETLR